MTASTIELHTSNLDAGIEALSRAAQTFQLTLFERISYRALMLSVDVVVISFAYILINLLSSGPEWLFELSSIAFFLSVIVGIVCLIINIPLFIKIRNEANKIKQLGLTSLSKSLWKENRRARWFMRCRGVLLITVAVLLLLLSPAMPDMVAVAFAAVTGVLLLGARYLRYQRERLELAQSATRLKEAWEGLRGTAGKDGVVAVPTGLVEQAAKIESAQIAKERGDAVLASAASRSSGYAVRFSSDAAQQRITLNTMDRIELEDVVAQLSIDGGLDGDEKVTALAVGVEAHRATASERLDVDYVVGPQSRNILVTAIRPRGGASGANNA